MSNTKAIVFVMVLLSANSSAFAFQATTTVDGSVPDASKTTTGCPHEPCIYRKPNNGMPNPHIHPFVPPTEEQLLQRRIFDVFGEIEGLQRYANETEKAGDLATAAAIRTRFERMSGFSAQEAEAIKELGEKYQIDTQDQHDREIATVLAVRKANPGVHMSRLNSPEIAAVQQERETLWVDLKAHLIQALGSRGFTRLDSYARHMHDNDNKFPAANMESAKMQSSD